MCQEKGKEGNRRLSAQQSATSARQELTHSPFCVILKTILRFLKNTLIHRNGGTRTYCSSACSLSYAQANRHLLHTITAMGIWASPSRLTYAAENSHQHHQTLDIHASQQIFEIFEIFKLKRFCRFFEFLKFLRFLRFWRLFRLLRLFEFFPLLRF